MSVHKSLPATEAKPPVRPPRSASPSRRRTRLAPEARREQILAAALEVFGRGGYHATHVDHVIRKAGVARGTFYLYFRSKHDVFAALVERMLAIFLEARPPLPDPEIRTPADAHALLTASYRAVLATFHQHRDLCRLLFDEAVGIDKGFAELLSQHFGVWHERVHGTLAHLVERGVARRDLDLDVTSDLVLGMVERLTRRHVLSTRTPDLDRLVEALVAFELRGIVRPR